MKGFVIRGAARAALATAAVLIAGAAAAQPAPGGPPPPSAPAPGGFPSVRNEDAAYRAGLARRAETLNRLSPVTDATLANPSPNDWLIWRRTYDSQGFSPLSQINKANVGRLTQAWGWALPVSPNEITPLVHDGVLFVASANRVQALNAATGDLLWQYVRTLPPALNNGTAAIAKNMAIYGDRLFVTTPDRHMLALDAKTGGVVWDHEIIPAEVPGVRITGGPIVAKGKVMIGVSSCNNYKGGCFVVALDTRTGDEAWRFYSIARPGQPGGDTWNSAPLDERFGGAVWIPGSYDPELNLIYYGFGQTYNSATLLVPQPGQSGLTNNDALYTGSTVALDPDTGKLAWHYQHLNRDVWDMDWVFERTLVTLPVDGVNRKLSVTAGKLAIFDAIDRKTGQYLFSKDLGIQNLISAIDPKTGHKTIAPAFEPTMGETKVVCPHSGGARSWPSTSYNPASKIIFVPLVETCMNFTRRVRTPAEVASGGSDLGWVVRAMPNGDGNIGRVDAINLETRKTVWSIRKRAPESSALLATAGGLLFEGSRDRMFRALDQATGKTLWETRLSVQPSSFPIAYAVNGKQYVAVVAGGGGAHDVTWPQMTPENETPAGGTTLYVFAVPGR